MPTYTLKGLVSNSERVPMCNCRKAIPSILKDIRDPEVFENTCINNQFIATHNIIYHTQRNCKILHSLIALTHGILLRAMIRSTSYSRPRFFLGVVSNRTTDENSFSCL